MSCAATVLQREHTVGEKIIWNLWCSSSLTHSTLLSDLNEWWARRRVSSPPRAAGSAATLPCVVRSMPTGRGSTLAILLVWPALVWQQVKLHCVAPPVCCPSAGCFPQCMFSWRGRISFYRRRVAQHIGAWRMHSLWTGSPAQARTADKVGSMQHEQCDL